MDLWNIKDLEPPPVTSCKACTKQIDVRLLHAVLQGGVNFFSNQHHLFTEAALLSRSVYRFKMKFRSSKDFKIVEKLNHILRTYQRMHISAALNVLLVTIPQNYKANNTYMLTKNMLDYVLVRLQGVGKLLCATLEACKEVSAAMQQRLRIGHFWKVAIVIFATAARIFVVAKNALKYCCELYGNLLPYSSSLGNSGVQWLPEGYIFPSHLDEWLEIDWLDLDNVIEILDDEPILSYLKLTDSDDEVEFCDEYILVKDDPISCIFVKDDIPISEDVPWDVVDIGEDSVIRCDDSDVERISTPEGDEDVGEVINISDSEMQTPLKRKQKISASKADTGENTGNNKSQTLSKRKRKKRVSKSLVENKINESDTPKRRRRKSAIRKVEKKETNVSGKGKKSPRKKQEQPFPASAVKIKTNASFQQKQGTKKKRKLKRLQRRSAQR